jgi:GDP-mannose 6-dehydrogenase
MKIAIVGLGHVGLTSAACLLSEGHAVLGIDRDTARVADLSAGICPISEPRVDGLLREGRAAGRLTLNAAVEPAVAECDLVIVTVGTPAAADGLLDLSQIAAASAGLATAMAKTRQSLPPIVYRSTMLPGSMETTVQPVFDAKLGRGTAELVYHPEFLRESNAVDDYFNPARIVFGAATGVVPQVVSQLYRNIAAPVFITSFAEAEMVKLVDNAWHAVKVTYANEIGRVVATLGLSVARIHEIFTADTKLNLSRHYTRPGGAFGGPCLPKDIQALAASAGRLGVAPLLLEAATASNVVHQDFLLARCTEGLPPGARILQLGLAFKPGGDDVRSSPNVELARRLLNAGYGLVLYDPFVRSDALPTELARLLVDEAAVRAAGCERVIDTLGYAGRLLSPLPPVLDLYRLGAF